MSALQRVSLMFVLKCSLLNREYVLINALNLINYIVTGRLNARIGELVGEVVAWQTRVPHLNNTHNRAMFPELLRPSPLL
jgi:hypothetical protein